MFVVSDRCWSASDRALSSPGLDHLDSEFVLKKFMAAESMRRYVVAAPAAVHHQWTHDWHISDWQFKSHDHYRSLSDCHWRSPVFEHEDRISIKKGGDNSFGGTCGLLREHNENCSMSESFMIERWAHFAELMTLPATRSPPLLRALLLKWRGTFVPAPPCRIIVILFQTPHLSILDLLSHEYPLLFQILGI